MAQKQEVSLTQEELPLVVHMKEGLFDILKHPNKEIGRAHV